MRAVSTEGLLKLNGLTGDIFNALSPNPEDLHVTFDDAPLDLLARLMQGTDEKLRVSFCFQVRPVMVAAAEPGEYSLLVGVDYTSPPDLADPYVGIDVIPSMGPRIDKISPVGFEAKEIPETEEVTLYGTDLNLSDLSVTLGTVELPVTMQRPDELRFKIDPAIIKASGISAGSHAVTVVQTLPETGKRRKSNSVIGNLVPTFGGATISMPFNDPAPPLIRRRIEIDGSMLGRVTDDTIIAFYKDGKVQFMLDGFIEGPGSLPDQSKRELEYAPPDLVPPGEYLMLLIVNGQQALQGLKVTVP